VSAAAHIRRREDAMLKIWGRKNSSNVQKVLWTCAELNVEFERVDWGGPFGGNKDPAYTNSR
jgi:glutathione S-transferase